MDENKSENKQDGEADLCVLCGAEGHVTFFALRGTDRGVYSGRILVAGSVLCEKDSGNFDMALVDR